MLTFFADTDRIDRPKLHAWLKEAYWARYRTAEVIDRSLENSLVFSAWEGETMVGFARVVTDRATFVWLCDVIVDPERRGRGIGKALVAEVLGHVDLKGVRWILGTRDAHALYEQFGFAVNAEPDRFMILNFPPRPAKK